MTRIASAGWRENDCDDRRGERHQTDCGTETIILVYLAPWNDCILERVKEQGAHTNNVKLCLPGSEQFWVLHVLYVLSSSIEEGSGNHILPQILCISFERLSFAGSLIAFVGCTWPGRPPYLLL